MRRDLDAHRNLARRLAARSTATGHSRIDSRRLDMHYAYSRLKPMRVLKDVNAEEDADIMTCAGCFSVSSAWFGVL